MLERHKLLMGRTQDRAGQNNGSIGVFWRSFNGIIGHIRYMFRGLKITHNHEHSSLYNLNKIFPPPQPGCARNYGGPLLHHVRCTTSAARLCRNYGGPPPPGRSSARAPGALGQRRRAALLGMGGGASKKYAEPEPEIF